MLGLILKKEVEQYEIEKNVWRVLKVIQNQVKKYQFLKSSQCVVLNPV